jgi:hypothetical protein
MKHCPECKSTRFEVRTDATLIFSVNEYGGVEKIRVPSPPPKSATLCALVWRVRCKRRDK